MARFLIDNKIDTSFIEAIPPMLPGLPIANVKLLSKSLVARSVNNSTLVIRGVLPGDVPISSLVFGGHNFVQGTGYQLQLFDVPLYNPADIVYDSGTLLVGPEEAAVNNSTIQHSLPLWFSEVNAVAFSITLTSAIVNPEPYFQIYRLFMGKYISTKLNISKNHSISWKENTQQYRTDSGTLRSDIFSPRKVIEFSLDTMDESDRSLIQEDLYTVGMQKEFYIDLFPLASGNSLYKKIDYRGIVKLTRVPKYTEFSNNFYKSTYIVEEV